MKNNEILRAYEQMAERYNELIDHKPHNAYYDRPNTLSLIPETRGRNILDAACGPGKYAEVLLARGATVTGFDISPKMIGLARARNAGSGDFFVHDLSEPLDRLEAASFDTAVCALALHYVEDWTVAMQEFYRVLKPGGALVLSVEHPFFEYNYFKSDKYFEVERVGCTWNGFGDPVEVNSYRRPLNACLSPLTDNGFYIDKLLEPRPTKEFEKHDPQRFKALNEFPAFLCIRAIRKE